MLERLFDEVVEVFGQTRFFHVGLDELFLFGQFPYRKETARKGVQNVVYDHIMWCYNYARKHNMQLMLWQDIFVTKEESPDNGSFENTSRSACSAESNPAKTASATAW